MNRIQSILVAVALLIPSAAFAVESLKANVNGMVCAFCAQGIEAKLRELPQTKDVYVNLGQKIVAVQIKDGASLSPDVVREVVKEAGYEVSAIEAVNMTAAQIKADTKAKAKK